jgi:hypothetical protein
MPTQCNTQPPAAIGTLERSIADGLLAACLHSDPNAAEAFVSLIIRAGWRPDWRQTDAEGSCSFLKESTKKSLLCSVRAT